MRTTPRKEAKVASTIPGFALRWTAVLALGLATLAAPAAAAGLLIGRAEVEDGARLVVAGETVRLHGIRAPAAGQRCQEWIARRQRPYPCGEHARAFLTSLVADHTVACVPAGEDTARCYAEGRDVAEAMVAAGWAVADPAASNLYLTAEQRARDAQRGMWAGPFELAPRGHPKPPPPRP